MNLRHLSYLILGAVAVLSVASCGDDDPDYILNPGGGSSQDPVPAAAPSSFSRLTEVPKLRDGNLFVAHSVAYQGDSLMNYCLEYDVAAHHSRWVAFRFDALTRKSNVGRSDEPFADDPDIPAAYHIGYNGFGSQYYDTEGVLRDLPYGKLDRGHLCASADRYMSREANEQTFYMSNISPQISRFNSPYWSSFENYVQKRGRDASFADTLFVVKGGTIGEGQLLGHVQRMNGAMVAIPKYYFMALLKCKNGTYSGLAFWMEHQDYAISDALPNSDLATKILTIDELEEKTGIDFFCNLPDNVEETVESAVFKSAWGF